MSKQIVFSDKAREKLLSGVEKLSKAVISTLGPSGRNVIIQKTADNPVSTKDGVTVAKAVELEDQIEAVGAQIVRQASIKTADRAGDGTTTSTLLAYTIASQAMNLLSKNLNPVDIKRGMDMAVKDVVGYLKSKREEILAEDQLRQVATISANNDPEVGELIASAMDQVGSDGVVTIEESRTGETYLETVEGMQFDRGYKSPYFVTDNNSMSSVLDNPMILIADQKLTQVKELLPILEAVSAQAKSLLIIAEDIDNEALAALIVNKMRGTLNVCAVKAPDFGDRRKLILEDIATTTGGQVLSKEKGMKLDKFSWDWFGEARTATITKETTTIVDGKGSEDAINARIEELQKQIEKAQTPFEIEKLQERLAKFVGGVAIIHVGGNTETEMRELKDRVDDALHATKAAIEEGIVPGGGVALLYASQKLSKTTTGSRIVRQACAKPFEQILVNAGFDSTEAIIVGNKLIDGGSSTWDGYNLKTQEIVNMKEAGIIDPTKVARTALQNAASVAGTILLTECTVVEEPSEDSQPQMDPMMGMM